MLKTRIIELVKLPNLTQEIYTGMVSYIYILVALKAEKEFYDEFNFFDLQSNSFYDRVLILIWNILKFYLPTKLRVTLTKQLKHR